MHNDIIVAGSRERPPMLTTERYAQWQSRFLRYVDMKSDKKELKKCIFDGPYEMTRVLIPTKPTTETYPPVPEHNVPETYENTLPENRAYIDAETEAIHMILRGIRDDIYSTVDACTAAKEIKFTSRDGESIESYYSRFYKMINEMYHNEDNEICAEKLANNANPLELVAAAQHYPEYHNQAPKPYKPIAPSLRQIISSNSHDTTRSKGKEALKQLHHHLSQHLKKIVIKNGLRDQGDWLADTDEEPDEQELEAHYMYMGKIHKVLPTESGPTFDAEPLEKVGSNVIPDSSDMCDNEGKDDQNGEEYEDERVVLANLIANLKLDADENKKIQKQLKKANTSLAHELKECKSALTESNDVRARCRSALHQKKVPYDKDDLANIFAPNCDETLILGEESRLKLNKDKYVQSHEKELDELQSNKTEFSNEYDLLLQECLSKDILYAALSYMTDIDKYSEMACKYLEKKECECLEIELSKQTKNVSKEVYIELLRSFAKLKKHSISLQLALQQYKNIAISELKKLIENLKGKSVDTKFDKPSVVRQPNAFKFQKPSVLGSDSFERENFSRTKSITKTYVSKGLSKPATTYILPQNRNQAVRNTNVIKPEMYRIDTRTTQTRAPELPQTYRNTNPRVSTSTGVTHKTSVSRPPLRSTQMKDKSVQIILFIIESGCTKHMMGNLKLLCNFLDKYLGLNHNLFSIGQFCDADLEVEFQKSTCFVRDLQGNDLLTGKAKRSTFKIKTVPSSKGRLNLLHMDLCGPMQIESINGKKYILMIVDDYSRYMWTHFLKSIDETPEDLFKASNYDNPDPAPQLQKTSVHNNTKLGTHDYNNEPSSSKMVPNVSPSADTDALSLQ
ncbi:retrovirus-related pol polyprotein from transposon TNT 1-94 [Tanacetum coccineum]